MTRTGALVRERGRVLEHVLFLLSFCNYDVDALARNWDRLNDLVGHLRVGPTAWSARDQYALEQILVWFPDSWLPVAQNALPSYSTAELWERWFYLKGLHDDGYGACVPCITFAPEPKKPRRKKKKN